MDPATFAAAATATPADALCMRCRQRQVQPRARGHCSTCYRELLGYQAAGGGGPCRRCTHRVARPGRQGLCDTCYRGRPAHERAPWGRRPRTDPACHEHRARRDAPMPTVADQDLGMEALTYLSERPCRVVTLARDLGRDAHEVTRALAELAEAGLPVATGRPVSVPWPYQVGPGLWAWVEPGRMDKVAALAQEYWTLIYEEHD